MPIYEYRCADCKKRTSVFVRTVSSTITAACDHCGGRKLSRLMSKFAVHGSSFNFDDESSMSSIDESDPRQMALVLQRTAARLGPVEWIVDGRTGSLIDQSLPISA